jgi:hypothetical protein
MSKSSNSVKTIDGLQSLLTEGVSALKTVRGKDLAWARTMISAVNSGNSLLRTEALLNRGA